MEKRNIVIGLPRALLYYRYGDLWRTFFKELNIKTIVSSPTSRETMKIGETLITDEACLSLKIYFGHVKELIGKCDYILVPHIDNYGRDKSTCIRFHALYDMTTNVFRETDQKFITYTVDALHGKSEKDAFIKMGENLGFTTKQAKKAYKSAIKLSEDHFKEKVKKQNKLLKQDQMKVLIVGHSYMENDAYIGHVITDFLKRNGVIPIFADIVDQDDALKKSRKLSPTNKWEMSRELIGSIVMNKDKVDGIILMTAFPCNIDSIADDLIIRRVKDKPILQLMLDGQSGVAGVETRLESFIDIIRFKEGTL